jgi:hypothetical protein
MDMQYIEKEKDNYLLKLNGEDYFFSKLSLYKSTRFLPIKPILNNGSLSWNIGSELPTHSKADEWAFAPSM